MIEPYDEMVDRELVQGRRRSVCAWHFRFFGVEKVMREAAPGYEAENVTHGICIECIGALREELEAEEEKKNPAVSLR